MKYEYNGTVFEAVFGKIEELDFDAIALPTTPSLSMDCGISSKIKEISGEDVAAEALQQAPAALGDAVLTGAGNISPQKIFHCVMLDQNRQADPQALKQTVTAVFEKAGELGLEKLAFPAIGASFPGLDPKTATEIIVDQSLLTVEQHPDRFKNLCFIVCDSTPYMYFKKALKKKLKKKSGKEKS